MKKTIFVFKLVIVIIPALILNSFNAFWNWWHFGPSQWMLHVGGNEGWSIRMMRKFIGNDPFEDGAKFGEKKKRIKKRVDELHK